MTKAKKISLVLSLILIIIGIVMFATLGFNYNLSYGAGKRIIVDMKDEFNLEDYKTIAKEIYGNAEIEAVTNFKDGVSIKVKDTTDEQLDNLASKINEKYGYEYTKDDLNVTEVSKINVWNILKQAIFPIITATLIVAVYMIVRYRKESIFKTCFNSIIPEVISILLVLSVYLIFRIPVTNILLPVVLAAYSLSVIYSALQFEK